MDAVTAEVVKITADRACHALLPNEILVVFSEPAGHALRLRDQLRFDDLALDSTVRVTNLTRNTQFEVFIASNNVHDARIPMRHGGSRTPTPERLNSR